jgi:hypothetical protein
MHVVEFQTTVHNGMITLPDNQQAWNGKRIKVILLAEASSNVTDMATNKITSSTDFFNCAGIWENRDDIGQESIRARAW